MYLFEKCEWMLRSFVYEGKFIGFIVFLPLNIYTKAMKWKLKFEKILNILIRNSP